MNHSAEIIVIDGESSDGSIEVLNLFKDSIHKLVVERDNGIFEAMNKGIKLASGYFIYFLNSGEKFCSDSVLSEVEKLLIDPEKIYYFNMQFHYNETPLKHTNNGSSWFVHQSCFVPRNFMMRFLFDENFKIFGDLDLWTRMKRAGIFNLVYVEKTICTMNLDGIGSSPDFPIKKIREKIYFGKKHEILFATFFSCINIVIAYLISISLGSKFLFLRYYPLISKLKNAF